MAVIGMLQHAIEELHGVKARHHESVPVKEIWNGETIWDGTVEIFSISGHPQTDTAYAWLFAGDDPKRPLPVIVLRMVPCLSPAQAVTAFLLQEYGGAGTGEGA